MIKEPTKTDLYKNILELELAEKYKGTALALKILFGKLSLKELEVLKRRN